MSITIHLIANAHLDPVWLWDVREGFNEGISTCRTVLNLMDEHSGLTFIRGEAAVYGHIEEYDPQTFVRIMEMVQQGRWDIVGGTWIQPDTNLSSTATLLRHFERGHRYFQERFGFSPRVAWAADSFGHSAGLPAILAAAGMTGFAFTRPGPAQLELPSPAFWWEGTDGSRILCYRPPMGWYGCERGEMAARLDSALKTAQENELEHVACFYGLGNHGGGPTRRLLKDLETWREAHPHISVVHSGLHRFFGELEKRDSQQTWPTFKGELGFCLRGCYSTALRVKSAYRSAENALTRTEGLYAAAGIEAEALREVSDSILLNSFHDILPGTSIERALEEQMDDLGRDRYICRDMELRALNSLAAGVDTSVPEAGDDLPSAVPFVIWNPHAVEYEGYVELEACLDARPLFEYSGKPDELPLEVRGPDGQTLPFQRIRTECDFFRPIPWRARVLVPVKLPALGWSVYTLGYCEIGTVSASPAAASTTIENDTYRIEAAPGHQSIQVWRNGNALLGEDGLSFETRRDEWGSWGGLSEEPDSLLPGELLHTWAISQVEVLETGPYRQVLWVRFSNEKEGGKSWLDLTFSLYEKEDAVQVSARLRWNESAARLKMVLPFSSELFADFEVPGAVIAREANGEVPGGRWVRTGNNENGFCFSSDVLRSYELREGALRPTIARASRYASDAPMTPGEEAWRPILDAGELKFHFLLAPFSADIEKLAREMELKPIVQSVPASPGAGASSGSLAALSPAHLHILSLRIEDGKCLLRAQNESDQNCTPVWEWHGRKHVLAELKPHQIGAWNIEM